MRAALCLILFAFQTSLDGPCVFGQLTEKAGAVSISGDSWSAVGYKRGNVIVLTWTQKASDRSALGVYQITDQGIEGFWGWVDDVEFDQQGNPTGLDHPERLR